MTDWQPMETAPKIDRDGDVPDEYYVWLYDPDAAVEWRVVPAFWNFPYKCWQLLEEDAPRVHRPTHWQNFVRPEAPHAGFPPRRTQGKAMTLSPELMEQMVEAAARAIFAEDDAWRCSFEELSAINSEEADCYRNWARQALTAALALLPSFDATNR